MAEYIDTSVNPADYIEVWEAEDAEHGKQLVMAVDDLKYLPTADVKPVVRGEWIDKPSGPYGRMQTWCSVCGERNGIGGIESNRHKPYCPNCGAYMRGGDTE